MKIKHAYSKPILGSLMSAILAAGPCLGMAQTAVLPPKVFPTLGTNSTVGDYLSAAPKPFFKPDNKLPRLAHADFGVRLDIQKKLAEDWGYGIEMGIDTRYTTVENVGTREAVLLSASNPKKYPLIIAFSHVLNQGAGKSDDVWLRDASGEILKDTNGNPQYTWSPEASPAVIAAIGDTKNKVLKATSRYAPISMVLNFGEDGVGVAGWDQAIWAKDPRVVATKSALGISSWGVYASLKKAEQEDLLKKHMLADVIWAGTPNYGYYQNSYGTERGRWNGWLAWQYDYTIPKSFNLSTFANPEHYYGTANSGWTGYHNGSVVPYDMLTMLLNDKAGEISVGKPYSYGWITAGWKKPEKVPDNLSSPELYMGFLKCAYTAGMIGAAAGYFSEDYVPYGLQGTSKSVMGSVATSWLWQKMVLSHAHGLFTQVDDLLLGSDLLAGPRNHPFKVSTAVLPLYELEAEGEQQIIKHPWGDFTIPTARVLARKSKTANEWLITAWANTGNDRNVTVTVPGLGRVTLLARKAGAVYKATLSAAKAPQLVLLDLDPMYPSATFDEVNSAKAATRIEAETVMLNNYRREVAYPASGKKVASLVKGKNNETGTVGFKFKGNPGIYDIVIAYVDETDGVSSFQFSLQGKILDKWIANSNLKSKDINKNNIVRRKVAQNVDLKAGYRLVVKGTENRGEHARIDYIETVKK
jgi:hypothetical protein